MTPQDKAKVCVCVRMRNCLYTRAYVYVCVRICAYVLSVCARMCNCLYARAYVCVCARRRTGLCLAYVHVCVTTCAYVAEDKARSLACANVCVRMRVRVCTYEPSVCARM